MRPFRGSAVANENWVLGADFYTRRESPEQQQAYLERRLQKLHRGCTVHHHQPPAGEPPARCPWGLPDRPTTDHALTRRLQEAAARPSTRLPSG